MSENMSQEEIDMLINSMNAVAETAAADQASDKIVSGATKKKTETTSMSLYKTIDFRKQNKIQYDNLGALKQIHEQFVKLLNNYLTMYLRCNIQSDVDFELIEQLTYQQYVNLGHKNSLWGVFSTADNNDETGRCFLQFDIPFCNFFLDRAFGGSDNYEIDEEGIELRMSDINKEISKMLFKNVLNLYEQTWNNSNMVSFDINLTAVDDNVQNINLGIMNSEMMLVIPVDVFIYQSTEDEEDDVAKTRFNIGIPYGVIEPILDKLNISNMLLSHRTETENDDIKTTISKMTNLVECYIGETQVTFGDLLNLEPGDIVNLKKKVTAPYTIYIGGMEKYLARPYKIGNKICLKIVE